MKNKITILKELFGKKSLYRVLVNLELKKFKISGKVVDVGGQRNESHWRFLNTRNAEIKILNIDKSISPDYEVDVEHEKFPVADSSQDAALCFNILEHISDEKNMLSEIRRVLKSGGFLLGAVPFLFNVHPDPHDYRRFTEEALLKILAENGFRQLSVIAIGKGPYTAAYSHIEFTIPYFLRPFFVFPAFWIDFILRKIKPKLPLEKRFPIAYIFYAEK